MEPRQAILVVSFRTSYNDSRKRRSERLSVQWQAFPAYRVRQAFTSREDH